MKQKNESAASDVFGETVTETLRQVLGESPSAALIVHLGGRPGVSDAKTLSVNLRRVTGSGSVLLQGLIVKAYYKSLGLSPEVAQGVPFEAAVERAAVLHAKRKGTA